MKRIIALIITFSLISASIPAFAQSDAYTISDSENPIELLAELGIFSSSDFSLGGEYFTRAEAARVLVKMTGVGVSASVSLPFTDVEESSENYGYIASAYAMKYISGVSASEFAPDAPITKPQTAKIIMSVLGYDAPCIASGGYPSGYMKYAGSVDLFDGVSLSQSEYITPDEMAKIVLNALRAELMIQSSFGDEIGYTSYDNKNLLSENFDIYVDTAVIESDKYTSLYNTCGTGTDEVVADSVIYDSSSYSGNVPVGCRCDIYFRQSSKGGKRELLSVYAGSENNTLNKLTSDDILSSSVSRIEYEDESGNLKKINISSNAAFLYNGQLASDISDIFSHYDEITAIDNNKDGLSDVIFINKYAVIQVKNLSKDSFTVYDKLSRQSYILDNTDDVNTVFYYDGGITDFYEIEKESVLSLLIPKNTSGTYTQTVYVSDRYEDALLEEVNASGNEVILNGNSYKISSASLSGIKAGEKYRFFFDAMGRIAAIENIENIKNYGYFCGIKNGTFGEVSVNIFTTDGSWLEAKLASRLNYNGIKTVCTDISAKQELFPLGQLQPQMVEYVVNSNGEIISMVTAKDVTSIRFTDEEYSVIGQDEFRLSFASASARYINSTGNITFGEKAHLSADATIMMIPSDVSEKEKFLIATPDKLTHNISYTGIKLYNCDEYACSSLAIVSDNPDSYRGTPPLVVSDVKTVINQDGDSVEKVFGFSRTTYETENDIAGYTSLAEIIGTQEPLKAGDIIIPVVNAQGKITNFERIHSAGTNAYGTSNSVVYSDYVTVYGKVVDSCSDYLVLDYSADKASFRLYSTSVYVCTPKRDGGYSVRLGSAGDINVGDDAVIRSYYLRGTVAVVYKK